MHQKLAAIAVTGREHERNLPLDQLVRNALTRCFAQSHVEDSAIECFASGQFQALFGRSSRPDHEVAVGFEIALDLQRHDWLVLDDQYPQAGLCRQCRRNRFLFDPRIRCDWR